MAHDGVPMNGHMSTITGHPSGFTEASRLFEKKASKKPLPQARYSLPPSRNPSISNQDFGIRVQPSWAEMQIWSNEKLPGGTSLAALIAPKPKKKRLTAHTQHAVDLGHPLESVNDTFVAPPRVQTPWRADERIMRHLRGAADPPSPSLHHSLQRPATTAVSFHSSAASLSSSASTPSLIGRATHASLPFCSSLDRPFAEREDERRSESHYMTDFCRPLHGHTIQPHTPAVSTFIDPPGSIRHGLPVGRPLPKATSIQPSTQWRRNVRVTAAEPLAGRAWGPLVDRVDKESRGMRQLRPE